MHNDWHLFLFSFLASGQEVFEPLVRFIAHAEEKVRSQALHLAVGLIRRHRDYPVQQPLVTTAAHMAAFRLSSVPK